MLTLIHGDDAVISRKTLDELKIKYSPYEKISFDGAKVTLTDIVSASDSLSLFGQQKLIIIENLLGASGNREKEAILDFLSDKKIAAEIIFWEPKEVPKTVLKKYFTGEKVIFCQLPPILFKFLDSIGEKPVPTVLSMFNKLTADREAEFILSMLIRQWRNLIIASDLGEKGFSGAPIWQAFKFIKQSRYFKLNDLISSYRQLLSLDAKIKMGLTPYSLAELLDIFFVSLYYQV